MSEKRSSEYPQGNRFTDSKKRKRNYEPSDTSVDIFVQRDVDNGRATIDSLAMNGLHNQRLSPENLDRASMIREDVRWNGPLTGNFLESKMKHTNSMLYQQYNTKFAEAIEHQNLKLQQEILANELVENQINYERSLLYQQKLYNSNVVDMINRQERNSYLNSVASTSRALNLLEMQSMKSLSNPLASNPLLASSLAYNVPTTGIASINTPEWLFNNRSSSGNLNLVNPLIQAEKIAGTKAINQEVSKKNLHRVEIADQRVASFRPNYCERVEEARNRRFLDSSTPTSSQPPNDISEMSEKSTTGAKTLKYASQHCCQYDKGCTRLAIGSTKLCMRHGGGNRCHYDGCKKGAVGGTKFCVGHGGGPRCRHPDCKKGARGQTGFCKGHGGGLRCQFHGCQKSAASGKYQLCITHGGGHRCKFKGCDKGAIGLTKLCMAHGGGPRCVIKGCSKGAQGSTKYCKAHGGGHRCAFSKCNKSASSAKNPFCIFHGGGAKKKEEI